MADNLNNMNRPIDMFAYIFINWLFGQQILCAEISV